MKYPDISLQIFSVCFDFTEYARTVSKKTIKDTSKYVYPGDVRCDFLLDACDLLTKVECWCKERLTTPWGNESSTQYTKRRNIATNTITVNCL